MKFFLSMEQHGGPGKASIELLPKVNEYLGLIMTLIFAFGLVFQLPVVMTLLARAGLVTTETLKGKRKWAIVDRLHRRGGADAARPDQPDQPGAADDRALRDLDLRRALHREGAPRGRGGSARPPTRRLGQRRLFRRLRTRGCQRLRRRGVASRKPPDWRLQSEA